MNPKEFMTRWIEGMKNLTPAQQLHGKMVGFSGGAVGLVLAAITMFMRKSWGFGIFLSFMVWLQVISFIGARQQYIQAAKIQEEINKNNILKELEVKENGI